MIKNNKVIFEKIATIILVLIVLSLCLFSLNYENSFDWIFGDRALLRAKYLLENFQIYAAEINEAQGARVPGGFLYYYLYILVTLFQKPEIIYLINLIFIFLSLVFFFNSIIKIFNYKIAVFSILFLITPPDLIRQIFINWNPTFGFGFYIFAFSFFINFVHDNKKKWLILSLIFISLSIQIHLSFLAFLFFLIFENFYTKRVNNFFLFKSIIFTFLFAYSPLIIYYIFINKPDSIQLYSAFFNNDQSIGIPNNILYLILNFFIKFSSFSNFKSFTLIELPILQIFIGFYTFMILKKINHTFNKKFLYLLISNIVLFFVVALIISLREQDANHFGLNGRYALFYLPLYSLFMGLSVNIIIEYFLSKKKYIIPLLILCLILTKILIFNILIITKYYYAGNNEYITYRLKNDIINSINSKFNTNSEFLLNNLSFLEFKESKIDFLSMPMQYQIENFEFNKNLNNKELSNCIFVLLKNDSYIDNLKTLLKMDMLNNENKKKLIFNHIYFNKNFIKPVYLDSILNVIEKNNFYIIIYAINNGSCYNNVKNPYILSPDESESLQILSRKKLDDTHFVKDNALKFFFNILDEKNKPIDISIQIYNDKKSKKTKSKIVSKRLRNYYTKLDGFYEKTRIKNPKLIITDQNNKKLVYSYYNEILGEKVTTPLTINLDEFSFNINKNYDILFKYTVNEEEKIIKLNQ
jgi:hypothetical protein